MTSTHRLGAAFAFAFALALAQTHCSGKVAGNIGDDAGSTTPPASCAVFCMRVLPSGCSMGFTSEADCEAQCNMAQAEAGPCGPAFDALLSCYDTVMLHCTNGQLDSAICTAEIDSYTKCVTPRVTPYPPPNGCAPLPPPAASGPCSGGSGGGGGSGGPQMTTQTCSDNGGHTWTATCTGSSCSCTYDGRLYCSCQGSGGRTCCPGPF